MTATLNRQPDSFWPSFFRSSYHDPAARIRNVDLMAALAAILLPWSTTGVAVAVGLWLLALAFTDLRSLPRALLRPACFLPIALFALALVGTLWSDAAWGARLHAAGQAAKLLVLPLLIYHFGRSPRGAWVFVAFLASCALLMLVSFLVAWQPELSLKLYLSRGPYRVESGIAVRNYIDQSQEFALCAVALVFPIATLFRAGKVGRAILLTALALGFLLNMVFVVVSRTTLVTLPIILAVFALLHLRWRVAAGVLCAAALLAVALWYVSPHLRTTVGKFFADYELTTFQDQRTGMGSRLEYWRKSLGFIAEAPLIGHGTGSTRALFERAAIGQTGVRAEIVGDPHNQTLNVAVQWGALGVVVLYAMWLAHLLLFRGEGLACWIGLLVVVQNVLSSVFNSHLFDFSEGWLYVLGVGIAGGMTLGERFKRAPVSA
jgi:O-antigen ligase